MPFSLPASKADPAPDTSLIKTEPGFEQTPSLKALVTYLWLPVLYTAIMSAVAVLLAPSLIGQDLRHPQALGRWDVGFYEAIRLKGYDLLTSAFFPAFPLLWRWLGLSMQGMALVNLFLFVAAFTGLSWVFRLSRTQQLLAISVPPMFFMAVPYSEAVFFVAGTLLLVGWQQQQAPLVWLGLVLCGFTRSVSWLFVPALLLAAWLRRSQGPRVWRAAAVETSASAAGLLLSLWIHYRDTGRWLGFVEAQRQFWGNRLQWPQWPLTNMDDRFLTRYESLPWLVGVGCSLYVIWLLLRPRQSPPSQAVLFSLLYTAGVTVVTLATKGGDLISLNRYVLATPFFVVLLAWFFALKQLDFRRILWLLLAAELIWMASFHAHGHIRTILWYSLLGLYVVVLLANGHLKPPVRQLALLLVVLTNSAFLVVVLYRFVLDQWAG